MDSGDLDGGISGKINAARQEAAADLLPEPNSSSSAPAGSPKDELVPHQLKAEILRQGREGMVQLSRGNDWASWKKVLPVLSIARSTAMLEANTNQPKGRRYCDAIGKWFRCHPEFEVLGKLDKGTRAHFYECLAKLEAIDEWRAKLPLEQQLRLNYPSTVLTHWKRCCTPAGAKTSGRTDAGSGGPRDDVAKVLAIFDTVPADAIKAALAAKELPWFLQVMPADWIPLLTERVVNLPRAANVPSLRESETLRRALGLVKIADRPDTKPETVTINEREALAALRALNAMLAGEHIDHICVSVSKKPFKQNRCADAKKERQAHPARRAA